MPTEFLTSEPTKIEIAASDACTRSGAFALLLTATLFLLIPFWAQRRDDLALTGYLTYRFQLVSNLELLDENPIWMTYKSSHNAAESMSVSELLREKVDVQTGVVQATQLPRGALKKKAEGYKGLPSPPTGLRVSIQSDNPRLDVIISPIAAELSTLNDSALLTRSRQVSNYFTFSIGRWAHKRAHLMYENALALRCKTAEIEIAAKPPTPDNFVPPVNRDALLDCLSLQNVRELANFELPTFAPPMQLQANRVQRDIEISPNILPRDLFLATVVGQLLLFFVIMHFGAFGREAVASETFPTQGTLFGAFSRSRWSLLILFLAIWSPVFASLGVTIAATPHRWPLLLCNLLIGCAVLFAYSAFHHKAYFGALHPRSIFGAALTLLDKTDGPSIASSRP